MQNNKEFKSDPLAAVLKSLKEEAGSENARALPPVHLWHPENCGDINIEIRRDGSWWHEGGRIGREKLVRLFSRILRKDEDGIYLVTPYEKVIVHVEDVPFIATRIERVFQGDMQNLVVTTNIGEVFVVDEDHPIRVIINDETQEPAPYVVVRSGLEARIARAPFYDLVAWSETREEEGRTMLVVQSAGAFFTLGPLGDA